MDLPVGYRFRAPTPDDVEAVARVLVDDQLSDGIEPTLDAFYLRQVWSRPDVDLVADAWVVTDDAGTIVAYGQLRLEEPEIVGSWGVVHPEQRGRGIGSALFDQIEARAAQLLSAAASPRFRHSINARDAAAADMAGARGLRPVRHNWHMQLDLDGRIVPARTRRELQLTGSRRPRISGWCTRSSSRRSRKTPPIIRSPSISGPRST